MFPKIRCRCTMGLIEKANDGVAERVEAASFTAVLRIQQQEKRNVCFVLMWLKKKGEDVKIFQVFSAKWAKLSKSLSHFCNTVLLKITLREFDMGKECR